MADADVDTTERDISALLDMASWFPPHSSLTSFAVNNALARAWVPQLSPACAAGIDGLTTP